MSSGLTGHPALGRIEQGILDSLESFTEGAPQTDDITFVIIAKNVVS